MTRKQKMLRIETGVSCRNGKHAVEREQLVQQGCAAAPVANDENGRVQIDPAERRLVDPLLKGRERRQNAARQVETHLESASDRIRMARAHSAPGLKIQIEDRPRPRA